MTVVLSHPDASVRVEDRNGKRVISVDARDGVYAPVSSWATGYPLELIEHVLRVKGPAYLCDEIMRDEDPRYVEHDFQWEILSYAARDDFVGRRVLDFGSGSGASTMVLSRMFPETQIVGVELVAEYVELARHRARHHGIESRVRFLLSPNASALPAEMGDFDYILLSAVYEHLLPIERRAVLEMLWAHLQHGGVMFLDQTPYRWFPIEMHTTGLPLLNYLPDRAALYCARRFSDRVRADETWLDLLRRGIRGATTHEVMGLLNRGGRVAHLLAPSRQGVRDHIDLWYRLSSSTRRPQAKRLMMWGFRAVEAVTRVRMVPTLSLAIQKRG